jgi:hypothetical protein
VRFVSPLSSTVLAAFNSLMARSGSWRSRAAPTYPVRLGFQRRNDWIESSFGKGLCPSPIPHPRQTEGCFASPH